MAGSYRAWVLLALVSITGCGSGPDATGESVDESEMALKQSCAPQSTVLGIDISAYQHPNGAGIDWAQVSANRRFVVIKASEGTGYTNSWYADDSTQARAHGMIVGAYHFLRYTSSGAAQAQHFLASVGGSVAATDLPPMLDVEDVNDAASPGQRVAIMKEWLDTVEAAIGRKPMIYSGSWYWGPYLGSPGGYGGVYPMVWAAYTGGSCPLVPDDFPGLAMWQYLGGEGTTPGIPAACDQDMFYGSEADLLALVDRPPMGWLDAAGCDAIRGWAQDPDAPDASIDVHVYFGGPAGSGAPGVPTTANVHREDLCAAIGSCEHGFSFEPPLSLFDSKPHPLYAYGIDHGGSNNAELSGSPLELVCAPTVPDGVKRHVVDPASFAAWKLDEFWDTLPVGDTEIADLETGGDLPAAPELAVADDGSPEVWLIDGTMRRHVPDPSAMTAWRFDWGAIQTKPIGEIAALKEGPAWRHRPVLLHQSDGTIWLVDDSATKPSTGAPPSGTGGTGGGAPAAGGSAAKPVPDSLTDDAGGGCSVRPASPSANLDWVALGIALGLARRRRARARS
jgi:GH25 family lysozyme M1 (1,4-beta-N-acetylmuramidase)